MSNYWNIAYQDEGRHTTPQPNQSEPQSVDSNPNQEQPSNATIEVLSRPVVEVPEGLHQAAIGLFTQPLLRNPRSQPEVPLQFPQEDQNMSPPISYSPQQYSNEVSPSLRRSEHQNLPKNAPLVNYSTPQPQTAATNPTLGYSVIKNLQHQPSTRSLFPSPTSQPDWSFNPIGPSCSGLQSQPQTSSAFIAPPKHSTPSASERRVLQCLLCQFYTHVRGDFNKHLVDEHADEKTCHYCSYIPDDSFSLKEHLRNAHGVRSDEELIEDELEAINVAPSVNAQGWTKIHRCKDCDFSSPNQHDYWRHIRLHMNSDKILECPKCPFTTELKHHFNYHIHNHFGKRPFKCDKCDYTCVNKSNLNSHKKSHSNVYQYNCADCSYGSKYCNGLKRHLITSGHNSGTVFNPDGTVNPVPVIDVYGSRRGPKLPRTSEQTSPTPECTTPSKQQPVLPLLPPNFENTCPLIPSQGFEFAYHSPQYLMNLHENHTMHFNPHITSPEPNKQPSNELQVQIKNLKMNVESVYGCETTTTTSPQSENNSSQGIGNVGPSENPQNITFTESTTVGAEARNVSVSAERLDLAATVSCNEGVYRCPFCRLTFAHEILYTIHMGYHGCVDPFTCNYCGVKTRDSVEFNIHIKHQAHY